MTLGIFNESESRIFGPLTKSRPNYLGNRDKLRISEESSLKTSEVWTNSVCVYLRSIRHLRQNTGTSVPVGFRTTPFQLAFRTRSMKGPATMVLFSLNKTVDIRLNDGHNDLLECKPQQCLEPSQYDRDNRCYLALQFVDSTNDECTTQPNPLEAFKWTKSLAFSG